MGGGFHRYSVDEYWFVPHFEKMLYDQAQLAISYLEAFQITHDELFAEVARRTLDYVLRDMTRSEGGFYSAEDADSVIDPAHPHEKGEGAFYVWTLEEIESIVGQPAARYFAYRYGVEAHGNVRNDPHAEFAGKNILFEAHTMEETEHHFEAEVREAIAEASAKLLAERGQAGAAASGRQDSDRLERTDDFGVCESGRSVGRGAVHGSGDAREGFCREQDVSQPERCCGDIAAAMRRFPGFSTITRSSFRR